MVELPRLLNPKVVDLLWLLACSLLPGLAYAGLARWTNVFGWLFVFSLSAFLSSASHDNNCEKETIKQLRSPDGVRIVVIEEEECDYGWGISSVYTTIRLAPLAHPDQTTELAFLDRFLDKGEHIDIAWSDPQRLRMALPLFSDMKILTQDADGVVLDIKFDPDDPATRAAWLAKLDEYKQAYVAFYSWRPQPSDPTAEAAWRADNRERKRTLDQKARELDDIRSRAAFRDQSTP